MKSLLVLTIPAFLFYSFCGPAVFANESIYSNMNYTGYTFSPTGEIFDYGTTTGGLVKQINLGYSNSFSSVNSVRIDFFDHYSTSSYNMWGFLKSITINNLPITGGQTLIHEYVLPEAERFELPSGPFGFTVYVSSGIDLGLASGGAGNQNELWQYDSWWGWGPFWFGGHPWAGLYVEIFKGPPIDEITCDIKGYKFDDLDGDGTWDNGEPAMPHWHMYLDENSDGVYQPAEPNAVTDPNGMYFFENLDSPAVYTVREMDKDGWTQTLPGGPSYQYVIDSEPNKVYAGYDFGNTTNPTKYGGGEGTEQNPHQIWTPQHMNQIGQNKDDWSSYFILMADIDMSAYQGTSYNIIGTTRFVDPVKEPFLGEFDGNGHSISNFTYQTTENMHYVGLFGAINSGGVKNLRTINPNIDVPNASYVGAIAGFIGMNVKIRDCDVIGGSINGGYDTGGIVGQTDHGSIGRCSNTATVQGIDDIGGIVGYARAGYVFDSYSMGPVTANDTCGGLVGDLFQYAQISRCYSTGAVSGSNSGGLVGISTGRCIRCFWDINTSNQTDSAEGVGLPTADLKQIETFTGWGCPEVWVLDTGVDYPRLERENTPGDLLPIPSYGGGTGEEASPYLIYTAEQFNDIGKHECHQRSHFKLMADIVLDPLVDDNYYVIGSNYSFYGVFDGNHHKIIHPRSSQDDSDVYGHGIFSVLNGLDENAVVKDLGIEDPVITSTGNGVGGLAGSLYKGTIENCYVKGGSVSGADGIGGLAGTVELWSENLIRNSYSNTTVSGNAYAGGLTSYFSGGTIESCYAAGPVIGNETTGGLIGYYDPDDTTVLSSFYDMDTTGQSGGQGTALSTPDMQMVATYTGWDFVNLWTICEGMNYPRFQWQVAPVDFICPDGVDLYDLETMMDEWLLNKVEADIALDGFVDLQDWKRLNAAWQTTPASGNWDPACDIAPVSGDDSVDMLDLALFTEGWLKPSLLNCDIAPTPDGDGRVDLLDFAMFTEYWMQDTGL